MDVDEYRRRYEAELAAHADPARGRRSLAADAAGEPPDPDLGPEQRIRIAESLLQGEEGGRSRAAASATEGASEGPDTLFRILRDPHQPARRRKAALRALNALTFLVSRFAPYRDTYLQVLRDVATEADVDQRLREQALQALAVERDDATQRLLLRGLEEPETALVPPAKAIQLLAYDPHSSAAPVVRRVFERTDDLATKEQALRLLASDPGSAELFAHVIDDSGQPPKLRALSATGLRLLDPESFEDRARSIVADDDEDPHLRATLLGALTHVREHRHTRGDPDFVERVKRFDSPEQPQVLRSTAKRFLHQEPE